jgi:hypothetical protein
MAAPRPPRVTGPGMIAAVLLEQLIPGDCLDHPIAVNWRSAHARWTPVWC